MRCAVCNRIKRRCLCTFSPSERVSTPIEVTLIQTVHERDHPKNSGALLRLGLQKLRSIVITLPSHHTPQPENIQSLHETLTANIYPRLTGLDRTAKTSPLLLYPQKEQARTSPPIDLPDTITELIVLDMTWGHSERLMRTSPILSSLPRLSLTVCDLERLKNLSQTEIGERPSFSELRGGKRRTEETSTLEATIYALIMIQSARCSQHPAAFFDHYAPLWESYERWINAQLAHRSTR